MDNLLKEINNTLDDLKNTIKENQGHNVTEVLKAYRDDDTTSEMEVKAIDNILMNKLILGKPEFALTNKLYPAYVGLLLEIIHHQAQIAEDEQDLHAISSKRILKHFNWLVDNIHFGEEIADIEEDVEDNIDNDEMKDIIDNPNYNDTISLIKDELKKLGFNVNDDEIEVVKIDPDGTEHKVHETHEEAEKDNTKKVDPEKIKADIKKGLDDGVRKGKALLNKVANKVVDMTK